MNVSHVTPVVPILRAPQPAIASRLSPSRIIFTVGILATMFALLLGFAPNVHAAVPLSPALRPLAQGVDTSKWQHPNGSGIDWPAAYRSGKRFTFIKATDGSAPGNDFYLQDARQARSAGLLIGSYHKAHPAQSAVNQAAAFANTIQKLGGEQLPPVLDIELDEGQSPLQLRRWTAEFLRETKNRTGRTPVIYTYRWFWQVRMDNTSAFADHPLWLAEYNKPEPTFPLIGGWTEWTFWQRAGNDGTSPGFRSAVDLNVFAGSTNDLKSWLGPVTPTSNAPTQDPQPPVAPVARNPIRSPLFGLPTKITIPAIPLPPGVRLPPGITLPMTFTLPTTGPVATVLALLRDIIPPGLLKLASTS